MSRRKPGGLADLLDLIKEKKTEFYTRKMIAESNNSFLEFTDLGSLDQEEINLFWTYPGGELERKIALRLATRTAQEAVMAAMAWESGKRRPCYRCGKKLWECSCITYCTNCFTGYATNTVHVCSK